MRFNERLAELENSNFPIYHGPRNKSLATYHLEYILHMMLFRPEEVTFLSFQKPILVQINEFTFNLSNILDADADLEQLTFTDADLNAYIELLKKTQSAPSHPAISDPKIMPHLHSAEKMAINKWTSGEYRAHNEFLRESNLWGDPVIVRINILTVCIANRALCRPLHTNAQISRSWRTEESVSYVNAARQGAIASRRVYMSKGLTASSANNSFHRGNITTEYAQPEASLNPLGKHVEGVSVCPHEKEVLFGNKTEFALKKTGENTYEAIPLRSINSEVLKSSQEYKHNFSSEQLSVIQNRYLEINMALLQNHIALSESEIDGDLKSLPNFLGHNNTEFDEATIQRFFHPIEEKAKFLDHNLQAFSSHVDTLKNSLHVNADKNRSQLRHNFFRRLFDTVSNEKKQAFLVDAINALETLSNEGVTENSLQSALQKIDGAINGHKQLVETAFFKSSLGRTHDFLSNVRREVLEIKAQFNLLQRADSKLEEVRKCKAAALSRREEMRRPVENEPGKPSTFGNHGLFKVATVAATAAAGLALVSSFL